jgi:hypothetical protein
MRSYETGEADRERPMGKKNRRAGLQSWPPGAGLQYIYIYIHIYIIVYLWPPVWYIYKEPVRDGSGTGAA